MKRSEINEVIKSAQKFFSENGWVLPPSPKWDVTDFGLGNFKENGLVLINLAEEPEYCEKLMYAKKDQVTPLHCHKKKKEDIICRTGKLKIKFTSDPEKNNSEEKLKIKLNGESKEIKSGETIVLSSGERVTISPLIYHEFSPVSDQCIIGEISTANDDLNDNFFINKNIGRYPEIDEDETPLLRLISDKK